MTYAVADMLCGAGGFTEAVVQALGQENVELGVLNHWDRAIETHTANHPKARHFKADVYELDPLEVVPSGELDLLTASPTCTFFSRARGGRPVSWDQRKGRMTPTQVYRWCKTLKVKRLIVENVPEFVNWGPICKRTTRCKKHGWKGPETTGEICGRPRAERAGVNFKRWVKRLENLGFVCQWRVLNSADYGDATTRERFFLMARSDGGPIHWPTPSHSKTGERDLFGAGGKRWRGAREVIKWKRRGRSIFNRKKPLAEKTLLRIHAGLVRFEWPSRFVEKLRLYMISLGITPPAVEWTGDEARPFIVVMRNHADARGTGEPLPAVMAGGTHMGLIEPLVMRADNQGGNGCNYRSADQPLYTPTTNGGMAVVEPFLLPQHFGRPARSVDLPTPTPVAVDRTGLVEPFVFPANQGRERVRGLRSVGEPLDTVVAKDMKALVEPFILNRHGDNNGGTGSQRGSSVDKPIPTPTASGAGYLVEPFVLSQGAGGAPRAISEPVPTIPTEGAHAFIAPYYGTGAPASVERPLSTITTRDRFGIVMPVTHADTSQRARTTDEPLPTVTSAPRGELAFITGAFGERPTQAPRTRSVDEPTPAICAKGRVPLVQGATASGAGRGEESWSRPDLADIDILFRMLEPDELAAAMGFPKRYRFKGNKTEKTRQIGNAVAVNTARALVAALMEVAQRG